MDIKIGIKLKEEEMKNKNKMVGEGSISHCWNSALVWEKMSFQVSVEEITISQSLQDSVPEPR